MKQEAKDTSAAAEDKKELAEEQRDDIEMETKELISSGHPLVLA